MMTLEQARRLTVSATSPKLLVTATSEGGKIRVSFADRAVRTTGEAELAREISLAVQGAFNGYRRGLSTVFGKDPMDAEHPRFPPGHPAAKRRRRFVEAAGELNVQCTSPGKVAQMRWRGVDKIDFRLRPGSLDRLDPPEEQLAIEVNAVIAATTAERHRAGRELFGRIHQPAKER